MKYFTEEYWKAVDYEPDDSQQKRQQAFLHYQRTSEAYHRELDELKPRLSKTAWNFFQWGGAETGLHDAYLLSVCLGDGLNYTADSLPSFRHNSPRALVRIEFINYTLKYHYTFELQGLKRAGMDIFVDENKFNKSIGFLSTYELTAVDHEYLRLGFSFATGAEIEFDFRRLIFKRRNLSRKQKATKAKL